LNSTQSELFLDACILIVDDELPNVRFLEVLLRQAGYGNVHSVMDSREIVTQFLRHQPDLILLDLHMPDVNGMEVMARLRPLVPSGVYLPILVLTADTTTQAKREALAAGAKDFLSKPLDVTEVLLRVQNLLDTRSQHLFLEQRVRERTRELEASELETVERLARAAEYRDDDTGLHTHRVGRIAGQIATAMNLRQSDIEIIRMAAPLHDVGKIGIHDSILLKPARLTAEEFEIMKQHTVIGARILSGSRSRWLQVAEEIALSHHERWDGKGYPGALSGEEIPLTGRVVAVADVFDALAHARPYKAAWPVLDAAGEILAQSGKQFDPEVVAAFSGLRHGDLL